MNQYTIFPLGDQAITLSLGNTINPDDHRKIIAMKHLIEDRHYRGILDIVVAYSSITILYDFYIFKQNDPGTSAFLFARNILEMAYEHSNDNLPVPGKTFDIPVCYEEPFAPDIEYVSRARKISNKEIIELHTSITYLVYMIAFLPGFPYLASVHDKLVVPRKDKPRNRVEAGSVGLAGVQTGVYPVASPGGWQIIGRTPLKMFDKNDANPVRLEAGDRVKFYAISLEEFHMYPSSHEH